MKRTICIVDDDVFGLRMTKMALEGEYNIIAVESATKMFEVLRSAIPDLIVLDMIMPGMSGFEALMRLKQQEKYREIPVIILSSLADTETRWLELGAIDFISKPYRKSVLLHRCKIHINIDTMIRERTQRIQRLQSSIVYVMANMVESRDETTGQHVERTTEFVRAMLEEMQEAGVYVRDIAAWDIGVVSDSARLHDIGKIAISDVILNKPDKLTAEEFSTMQTHTVKGEGIIDLILARTGSDGDDFLRHARLFAGAHHEKWDGSGYPCGLCGLQIPLEARIMAPADVYDALTNDRPYRARMSHSQAREIITAGRGTHFDPQLVDVFLRAQSRLKSGRMLS